MRAPAPSFRNELAAFRNSRHSPKEYGAAGPSGLGNRNSADMELLARWLDDERSEENWAKIKRRAPNLAPADFIQAVLTERRRAAVSVNLMFGVRKPGKKSGGADWTLPGFNNEWDAFLPSLRKQINRLSDAPPIEVAEFLENVASYARLIIDQHFGQPYQVDFRFSRQGLNEDRYRNAFVKLITRFLRRHCNQPLHDVTPHLTEIAFPGKEISLDYVKDVLRPRKPPKKAKTTTS